VEPPYVTARVTPWHRNLSTLSLYINPTLWESKVNVHGNCGRILRKENMRCNAERVSPSLCQQTLAGNINPAAAKVCA